MSTVLEPTATNYDLDAVWPRPSAAIREEVIRFWLAEAALLSDTDHGSEVLQCYANK